MGEAGGQGQLPPKRICLNAQIAQRHDESTRTDKMTEMQPVTAEHESKVDGRAEAK